MRSFHWLKGLLIILVLSFPMLAQKKDCPPYNPENKIYRPKEVDKKAEITRKPSPDFTEEARRNGTGGKVVIQLVLAANGEVKNIRTVSGLPDGLTEQAIKAAHRIKFRPAIKNDCPVSQYLRVEYNFMR
jgi:TonB family C-terminal domain